MIRGIVAVFSLGAFVFLTVIRFQSFTRFSLDGTQDIHLKRLKVTDAFESHHKNATVAFENHNNNDADTELEKEPTKPKRPPKFFVMHIGPSKTGTSSIQKDLARKHHETKAMDEDNVIYVGKAAHRDWPNIYGEETVRTVPNINGRLVDVAAKYEIRAYNEAWRCMREILENYRDSGDDKILIENHLETNEETRASLREQFLDGCWVVGEMDYSYMLNYSLIDSHEEFSYSRSREGTSEKIATRLRIFDILGYERLVVVGAYRRYADHLVSAYTESIKIPCIYRNLEGERKHIACSPSESFLVDSLAKDGEHEYDLRFYGNIHKTLPEIIAKGPSNLEAKVLNYFQLPHSSIDERKTGVKGFTSITIEFYCDALDEMIPNTCSHARIKAREKSVNTTNDSSIVTNKGSISDAIYQRITAFGYQHGYIHFTRAQRRKIEKEKKECKKTWCSTVQYCVKNDAVCEYMNESWHTWHDQITQNGNITIVGTNESDITMFADLASHHTKVHKKTWTKSLPIICPNMETLNSLLQKSLDFEKLVMPDFSATPLGEEEHRRLFWDVWFKEKRRFCTVDVLRLFEAATTWDEIINDRMVNQDWGEPRMINVSQVHLP